MTPTALADLAAHILATHHAFLHAEMPRLAVALAAEPREVRAPFEQLRRLMDEHMGKEEMILFPAIRGMALDGVHAGCGVAGPIAQMGREHEDIRALEATLRALAPRVGALAPELLLLLDDLSTHANVEDEQLFPAALALEEALLRRGTPVDEGPDEGSDEDALDDDEPPDARPAQIAQARGATTPSDAAPTPAMPRRKAAVVPPPKGPAPGRVLRRTRGVCSTCHAPVPAEVVTRGGVVQLEKTCPTHGVTTQLLSRQPQYWGELDRFYFSVNREEYPQRDYIVRMTERCNLACPICLAKANTEDTPDLDLEGLATLLSERRGIKIDLMAAEPTLRADLLDWVRRVKASGNIAALHTNGIKLADADYVAALAQAGVDEVFLQFDGLDDKANTALRGRPLLKARMAALANLRKHGVATSLIVVIARGLNEAQVHETFRFALQPENDHIREVFFLGLRGLGSARHTGAFADQLLMPDEIIDLLAAQEPTITRDDIHAFNLLYFAMLSAFKVRKCLYVQHYLVARAPDGGFVPVADILDLRALSGAAVRYATRREAHPTLARAGLAAAVVRQGLRPGARGMAGDFLRLERLFATGMNLHAVPKRFLLLGFITACDPDNFDADVAVNCGKGELSVDGGFTESSAVANVEREARFTSSNRDPGPPRRMGPGRR